MLSWSIVAGTTSFCLFERNSMKAKYKHVDFFSLALADDGLLLRLSHVYIIDDILEDLHLILTDHCILLTS